MSLHLVLSKIATYETFQETAVWALRRALLIVLKSQHETLVSGGETFHDLSDLICPTRYVVVWTIGIDDGESGVVLIFPGNVGHVGILKGCVSKFETRWEQLPCPDMPAGPS
jgi:hypothetical protein